MKGMVTESSLALPMSTLYTMCLFKVMKQMGIHEGPIEQVDRLFRDKLYGGSPSDLDEEGRIRMDELELMPSVQREVQWRLDAVSTDTLSDLGDVDGFYADWLRIYGFGVPDVDYRRDVDPVRALSAEFASLEG